MKRLSCKAVIAACIGLPALLSPAFSQQLTLNPQSYYGVGDLVFPSSPRNAAMGGAGVATTSYFTVNQINPATWADITLSTLDVSGFGQISQLRNATNKERQVTGSFQNAGMAFPTNKGLVFALGFAPYSVTGYNAVQRDTLAEDSTVVRESEYTGSGGLNRVYGGVSGKWWNKRILWGVSYSFNFGELKQSTGTTLSLANSVGGVINRSTYIHGNGFQGGIIFCDTLLKEAFKARPMKDQKFPLKLRIGATVDYTLPLKANQLYVSQTVISTGTSSTIASSHTYTDSSGRVGIPLRAGFGVELSRPGKFSFTADGFWQNWSDYTFYGESESRYASYMGVNAGIEWIPDIVSSSYFKRFALRAGGYYHQLPLRYNGTPINDAGVTIGLGIPPARGSSSINLAASFGKRGSLTQGHLSEELYARIQLGFTLNERWFIRRVID